MGTFRLKLMKCKCEFMFWCDEMKSWTLSPSKSSRRFGRFDSPFSSSTLHPCHFTNFSRVKFGIQQFQEESGQNRKIGMRGVHVLFSFSIVGGISL